MSNPSSKVFCMAAASSPQPMPSFLATISMIISKKLEKSWRKPYRRKKPHISEKVAKYTYRYTSSPSRNLFGSPQANVTVLVIQTTRMNYRLFTTNTSVDSESVCCL